MLAAPFLLTNPVAAACGDPPIDPEALPALTPDEIQGFRNKLASCWNIPKATENTTMRVKIHLEPDGTVSWVEPMPKDASEPENETYRLYLKTATEALYRCQPYNLPRDKYASWCQAVLHFSTRDVRSIEPSSIDSTDIDQLLKGLLAK